MVKQAERLTLRKAWKLYHKSTDHADTTSSGYGRKLKHWERLTEDPDVRSVTSSDLRVFRSDMATTPLPTTNKPPSPNTVNGVLRVISAIYGTIGPEGPGYPDALGLVDKRPTVSLLRTDEPEPTYVSAEDLSRIYAHAVVAQYPKRSKTGVPPGDWWRALVVYLFNCGDRRGEFLSLRWDQVDLEAGSVRVHVRKSRKWRTKPMAPAVVEHLTRIKSDHELVFCCGKARQLTNVFRSIQEAAGVSVARDPSDRRGPWYTFHELRKTCATSLWTINPAAAQAMLCHSDLATTARHYAGIDPTLEAAASQVEQPAAWATPARIDWPPTGPAPEAPTDGPDDEPPDVLSFPGAFAS